MGATTEISCTWAQALAWRMEQHLLDPVGSMTASGTVGRLGAVLSVDESLAELAVRTRSRSSPPGELAQAVADGTVIQSFLFRGALHYLTPDDGAMYLALRAAGRQWELPSWVDHYGLAAEAWPRFRAAVRDALGDAPLTVTELGEALTVQQAYRHLRPVFEAGAGTLIKPLSWLGDISLGPRRDGRLTLRRLDGNPAWRGVPDLDEAGPRAVSSYLAAYGPATVDHLHYWLGEGLSAGRKRITGWFAEPRTPAGRGRCRGDRRLRLQRARRRAGVGGAVRRGAAAPRTRPVGDGSRHQGCARDPGDTPRRDHPQSEPRDSRRRGPRHLDPTRPGTRGLLAVRPTGAGLVDRT